MLHRVLLSSPRILKHLVELYRAPSGTFSSSVSLLQQIAWLVSQQQHVDRLHFQ